MKNNTEKLLRAFIEASGYQVEERQDIKHFHPRDNLQPSGEPELNVTPESTIKTVDYKVTKKESIPKAEAVEFIDGYGYSLGVFVSNNGKIYRSLVGDINNLNYKELSDECSWMEYRAI